METTMRRLLFQSYRRAQKLALSSSNCYRERARCMSTSTNTTTATMDNNTNSPAAEFNPHFVVVSLGNPSPYAESLHSAGHVAVQALQQTIRLDHNQPNFDSHRVGKKAAQVSRGSKYTLLQSPTLMNVSGPWVAKAWADVLSQVAEMEPDRPVGLVVVHDELEEDMCIIKTRKWERSHRGHNGLKSCQASIQQRAYPNSKLAKISVGIGRPEGRDHGTVSDYVLKPWSKYQKSMLMEKTGPSVLAALQEIEATWKVEREKGVDATSNQAPPTKAKKMRKNARAA